MHFKALALLLATTVATCLLCEGAPSTSKTQLPESLLRPRNNAQTQVETSDIPNESIEQPETETSVAGDLVDCKDCSESEDGDQVYPDVDEDEDIDWEQWEEWEVDDEEYEDDDEWLPEEEDYIPEDDENWIDDFNYVEDRKPSQVFRSISG